jgi:hypothetical protein
MTFIAMGAFTFVHGRGQVKFLTFVDRSVLSIFFPRNPWSVDIRYIDRGVSVGVGVGATNGNPHDDSILDGSR